MFSGCGGMDLGFTGGFEIFGRRYRSLPFEVVWANDTNGDSLQDLPAQPRARYSPRRCWALIDTLPKRRRRGEGRIPVPGYFGERKAGGCERGPQR